MVAYKLKKKKVVDSWEDFETYMVEIGRWIRTDTGIAENPKAAYVPAAQINDWFKAWKKRREQK